MGQSVMRIFVNEQPLELAEGLRLSRLRLELRPDADVIIVNGHAISDDLPLADGDRVTLIRRGDVPPAEELEALLVARHTPGVHDRLKTATVAIAGVGGLGSPVAIALARSGIGRLLLADFDVVEPSNLNRQQYFIDQIGLPKVEALKANLQRINPYVQVDAHRLRLGRNNIPSLFAAADIIVVAFDRPDQKAMLVECCLATWPQKPVVSASGLAGFGPSNAIQTRRALGQLILVGDGDSEARPGEGLMAPRVGIAAHHQANAVLRLLLGEEPA